MKDWLTVIIILLIVGIVLDGVRRMRQARRENLRVSRNARKADLEPDVAVSTSEFPSGGARVAAQRDARDADHLNKKVRRSFENGRVTAGAPQRIPEQVSLNLEESVPLLMDSVGMDQEDEAGEASAEDAREPQIGSLEGLQDDIVVSEPVPMDEKAVLHEPITDDDEPAATTEDSEAVFQEPDEVLIINVMAKSGQRFAGSSLLAAMTECGLKFGDMEIFHRHLDDDGDGPVIYSLANMVVPGTFSLAEMDNFETPGVSLFLSLPVAGESIRAYDDMTSTARRLAEALDGELKDENRSVMTNQTIEHGRQRVIEYERKQKLAR